MLTTNFQRRGQGLHLFISHIVLTDRHKRYCLNRAIFFSARQLIIIAKHHAYTGHLDYYIIAVTSYMLSQITGNSTVYCSGSLEPESSCHDRDWIMELPMEADILIFTGILTPEDASVASCFPFDITISLSWFPLLSIPPLHSAIP